VLERAHGVDGQVGCIRPCLVQSRYIESHETHHNRPKHSLQNHYDQQPNFRHYAASDASVQGRSCFDIPYSPKL
jgi:hypothetical protein